METVYHFTSPDAALSILRDKKLWFTDCEYLNDQRELAYCLELYNHAWVDACLECGMCESQINHAITEYANPFECESALDEQIGRCVSARYYVLCTGLCGDNASLWANYARGSGTLGQVGYALELDASSLTAALTILAKQCAKIGLYVEVLSGSVCYDIKEQMRNLKVIIRNYLHKFASCSANTSHDLDRMMREEIARNEHWAQMSALAPFMKAPGFSGEQEYRFVLKVADYGELDICEGHEASHSCDGPATLRLRTGYTGVITPFLEVSLSNDMKDILRSVYVAASTDWMLARHGVERLLTHSGYRGVPVRHPATYLRW